MHSADFLVIGGGVAGLSAAASLARHGKVIVLEAEDAIGFHSSGRSATFLHLGIGNETVRGMTIFSTDFFVTPPEGFSEAPLSSPSLSLYVANASMLDMLDELEADMTGIGGDIAKVSEKEMRTLCPVLNIGDDAIVAAIADRGALKLDAGLLLQGYARALRAAGGIIKLGQRIATISRAAGVWTVTSTNGEVFSAPIVVNAAGAWADRVGMMAGVQPLGLAAKRRTIIVFDPPAGIDSSGWPFVKTVTEELYFLPESGRLLASPVDENDSDPVDAQPEEYDIALTAWRVEQWTTMQVPRIAHSWAGLRSFVADRVPTAGFAPDAEGFFWLAGQGGYGLQTAPAMAAITEALVTGGDWPSGLSALGVEPAHIKPERLQGA